MIEKIEYAGQTLAIIVPADFRAQGLSFITPSDALLQLGYMSHPAGYLIPPHVHTPYPRNISGTQEVLFIKSGRVRVDFYNSSQDYLESRELRSGDWVVLLGGGHGFEMLEPTTMIEVKNGPYAGAADKTRFTPREGA